jgi:prevent-host-death family protein
MSELHVEDTRGVAEAAHEAARGEVVYITEHGRRLAAIVPAGMAAEIEEDLADARDALAEPGEIPWEQIKAEVGL